MPKNDTQGPVQKTFYYHADASAIGGTIHRPFVGFVPSQTSISLPLVGGFIEKQRKSRKWKDIVSYESESTRVSGSQQDPDRDGPWTTDVSASIERLNILGVIEADKVVAQLAISHPYNGDEPSVRLLGSQFENLRISGVKIDLGPLRLDLFEEHDGLPGRYPKKRWPMQKKLLDKVKSQKVLAIRKYAEKHGEEPIPNWIRHHFHELESLLPDRPKSKELAIRLHEELAPELDDSRFEKLRLEFLEQREKGSTKEIKELHGELVEALNRGKERKKQPAGGFTNDNDYVICSLIDHFPDLPPHFPGIVCGNAVYLPGYGRFHFGEVIVQQGTYRVSMIRAQLGSGTGGAMSAAVASSNGQGSGPRG